MQGKHVNRCQQLVVIPRCCLIQPLEHSFDLPLQELLVHLEHASNILSHDFLQPDHEQVRVLAVLEPCLQEPAFVIHLFVGFHPSQVPRRHCNLDCFNLGLQVIANFKLPLNVLLELFGVAAVRKFAQNYLYRLLHLVLLHCVKEKSLYSNGLVVDL